MLSFRTIPFAWPFKSIPVFGSSFVSFYLPAVEEKDEIQCFLFDRFCKFIYRKKLDQKCKIS